MDVDKILWADSMLRSFESDLDSARIYIECQDDLTRCIQVDGLLGLEVSALWDCVNIETVGVVDSHDFLRGCLGRIGRRHGQNARTLDGVSLADGKWLALAIVLIDGTELVAVGSSVVVTITATARSES